VWELTDRNCLEAQELTVRLHTEGEQNLMGAEMDLQELEIQQGEGKWIKFTISSNGSTVDMTGAVKTFGMKENQRDTNYVYRVDDGDVASWDISEEVNGIIRVNIPASTTSQLAAGKYDSQAIFEMTADTDVDKTQKFIIKIVPAVVN